MSNDRIPDPYPMDPWAKIAAGRDAMVRHATPEDAVLWIAKQYGVWLHGYIARDIADAVLATADEIVKVSEVLPRELADEAREHVRTQVRRDLLIGCADQGVIPTRLSVITEVRYDMASMREVPAGWPEQYDRWTHWRITASVPVRMPPVDRAAAVKAGIPS